MDQDGAAVQRAPVPHRLGQAGVLAQAAGPLQPPLVLREALGEEAALQQGQGQVPMPVRHGGLELDRLEIDRLGFGRAALAEQRDAQVAPAAGHGGPQRQGVAEMRLGLDHLVAADEDVAERGVGFGQLGVQFDGAAAGDLGVIEAAHVQQALAEVAVGFRRVGIELQGLLEGGHRLGVMAPRQQRQTQVGLGGEQLGHQRQGVAVGQDRAVQQRQHVGGVLVAHELLDRAAQVGVGGGLVRLDGQRVLVDRNGLAEAAQLRQHQGVVLQQGEVARGQVRRVGVVDQRLVEIADALAGRGQVAVRLGIGGAQADRLQIGLARLGEAHLAQQGVAEVEPHLRRLGRQRCCGAQRGLGLFRPAQLGQQHAQVGVGVGIAGLQGGGGGEVLGGGLQVAERAVGHAEVAVGRDQARVEPQRLGRGGGGLFGPAELVQGVGQVGQVRPGAAERQRPLDHRQAVLELAALLGQHAQQPPALLQERIGGQALAIERLGGVEPAGVMLGQAAVDQLAGGRGGSGGCHLTRSRAGDPRRK